MSIKEKCFWIVTSAWPTINNIPHLGTILQLLSADVLSRYLRLVGEQVISVSGSDVHGTPVLISSEAENETPEVYSTKIHKIVLELLEKWNIRLDNYSITTTPYHKNFVQTFYKNLKHQQTIFLARSEQFYCSNCDLFLPDRFIEGTCPICKNEKARGDQCPNANCNAILTPEKLINPYCIRCKATPIKRQTQHWYLDLPQFESALKSYIESNNNFSPLVINEALKFFEEGLNPRAITRDLSWGIDASFLFTDQPQKVFYVWSEDVLGYLSASAEFIDKNYPNLDWKSIWRNPATKTVYCLGLDNIFFHAIWFPALLLASKENFVLPTYLSTTQFLQFNGEAFSKSKNIGLWIDEALEVAQADFWRFYLIYYKPDKKSHNFEWETFVKLINDVLISNIVNLVYRICSLSWRYNHGKILLKIEFCQASTKEFLLEIEESINNIFEKILKIDSKSALQQSVLFSKQINSFLSKQEPWKKSNSEFRLEDITLGYIATGFLVYLLEPVIPTLISQFKEQLSLKDIHFTSSKFSILDWFEHTNKIIQLPKLKKLIQPLVKKDLEKAYQDIKQAKNFEKLSSLSKLL